MRFHSQKSASNFLAAFLMPQVDFDVKYSDTAAIIAV